MSRRADQRVWCGWVIGPSGLDGYSVTDRGGCRRRARRSVVAVTIACAPVRCNSCARQEDAMGQGKFALALLALALALPAPAADLLFKASFDEAPEGPFNEYEAARFLTQATFGPTLPEIQRLQSMGYNAWLTEQLAATPSLHTPLLDARAALGEEVYQQVRQEAWFTRTVTAPDQLRQRVAFALSEILV